MKPGELKVNENNLNELQKLVSRAQYLSLQLESTMDSINNLVTIENLIETTPAATEVVIYVTESISPVQLAQKIVQLLDQRKGYNG